jgi:hypothetical protein
LRRCIAILLLGMFGFAPLSPAFSGAPETNLPACCRRDGRHHCSTPVPRGSSDSGPGFRSRISCPLYPQWAQSVDPSSAFIAPVDSFFAPHSNFASPLFHGQTALISADISSHHLRGPPFSSLIHA